MTHAVVMRCVSDAVVVGVVVLLLVVVVVAIPIWPSDRLLPTEEGLPYYR